MESAHDEQSMGKIPKKNKKTGNKGGFKLDKGDKSDPGRKTPKL